MNEYTTKFKVCTFNLLNYIEPPNAYYELDNIYTKAQWAKKEAWLSNQLSVLAADIIGFQEVFSPEALKTLVSKHNLPFFQTVSEPGMDQYPIFNQPVVAIASRFPIISATEVKVNESLIKELKLQPDFNFSRAPIRAEISIDGFSTIIVYVVHLKSKRSKFERETIDHSLDEAAVREHMLADIHGRWASNIQRGTEASMLYQDFADQMRINERPTIVLGDLNDTIESAVLQQLVAGRNMDKLGYKFISGLSKEECRSIARYSLFDAFDLNTNAKNSERKPTHYFANKGNTLDYILMSKDFNAEYDHSLATVSDLEVSNNHLENPIYENDAECSDHAPVIVTVEIRL